METTYTHTPESLERLRQDLLELYSKPKLPIQTKPGKEAYELNQLLGLEPKLTTSERFATLPPTKDDPQILEDSFLRYYFDCTAEHKEPEPIIKQGDRIVMTKGNFSCISGQAKSRKTFLTTAITGCFLSHNEFLGFNPTEHTGSVLYCDTEQSEGHFNRVVRRIQRIAGFEQGKNDSRLTPLSLREADPTTRRKVIEYAIERNRPLLVVIDGVADLFTRGTNDESESIEVSNWLLQTSSKYDCHIIVILHTNPGSQKMRGHIGSEVTRKAETVLNVSKHDDSSIVEPMQSRDIDIQKFAFFITNEGLPMLTEVKQEEVKASKKDVLKLLFEQVFSGGVAVQTFASVKSKVKNITGKSDTTAENRIKEAMHFGIIVRSEQGYYTLTAQPKPEDSEDNNIPF